MSYSSTVLGAAPLLYWRLDETTGTVAADASGSGNGGTYTSDAASFTTAGLVDNNGAIAFTGTNSQIGVTRSASPLNHTKPWTAVILAQPTAAPPIGGGVGALWVLGTAGAPEIDVLDAGAGRFRIRVMSSGMAQLFVSSSSWAYGTKVLAVARYNGSVISLNVNGAAEGQASRSYGNPGGVLRLGFGVFSGGSDYYPLVGVLDEFSLHQSYLSDTQVQSLYAAVVVPPALSAYAAAQTPLGTPAILAASGEALFARAAAATPLGTPLALARAVGAARVATAGPLGAGAALGQLVAVARAAASGPLGDPAVRANQPHVFARAQGFNSTAFGTPSFATRLQAAGFSSTAFGTPSSPVPQTVVASGFSKTSFGRPFGFQYIQPKIDQVVSASPLATAQFGLPSAFIDATVQAAGSTSGQFGTPTTKIGLGAQAIAPATSWGAPLLLLSMRAQGFGRTSFGVPHAAMVQHAASTYRATRWGIPTCVRSNTYLARSIASTPRFGRPTARKINAYQASSMAPSGLFGTPACALRYRALGIHGVARFGKPLLIRSAAC